MKAKIEVRMIECPECGKSINAAYKCGWCEKAKEPNQKIVDEAIGYMARRDDLAEATAQFLETFKTDPAYAIANRSASVAKASVVHKEVVEIKDAISTMLAENIGLEAILVRLKAYEKDLIRGIYRDIRGSNNRSSNSYENAVEGDQNYALSRFVDEEYRFMIMMITDVVATRARIAERAGAEGTPEAGG